MDETKDDLQLAERAASGDRLAQAQLLRQWQDVIYRYCLAQLSNEDLAVEATQETGLRVLTNIKRFAGHSRLRTWVLGIALNVCREIRRRRTHQVLDHELTDRHNEPHVTAINNESVEKLHSALNGLGERQREALILRYFEKLSVNETAEVMNIAPGTVKATVAQALDRLRDCMSSQA